MAKTRTYLSTDDELIVQGKLIVAGEIVQRQYNLSTDAIENSYQADSILINSNGFNLTGSPSNASIKLRSGDTVVELSHNAESGNLFVNSAIVATDFVGNIASNISVSQITNFVPETRQTITVSDPTSSALSYSNVTGVIEYTGVNQTDIVTLSGTQTITGDKTFTGEVDLSLATVPGFTVNGNLNVIGELNSVTQVDLYVENNTITLNKGNIVQDASILVDRGTSLADSSISWDETNDVWRFSHAVAGASGSNLSLVSDANILLTTASSGTAKTWNFTQDGRIIFPDGNTAVTSGDTIISEGYGITVTGSAISIDTANTVSVSDAQTISGDKTFSGTVDFSNATVTGIETAPGGNNTEIQFNNAGAFGGDANLTWDASGQTLNVGTGLGSVKTKNIVGPAGDIGYIWSDNGSGVLTSHITFSSASSVTTNFVQGSFYFGSPATPVTVDFTNATITGIDTYSAGYGISINSGVIETNNAEIIALISNVVNSESITVNSNIVLTSESVTLATVTPTAIASFDANAYTAAKYVILAKDTDNTASQVSEMLIVHDGAVATATEYGTISTDGAGATVATYEVSLSGSDVVLYATGTSTASITYNISETLLS